MSLISSQRIQQLLSAGLLLSSLGMGVQAQNQAQAIQPTQPIQPRPDHWLSLPEILSSLAALPPSDYQLEILGKSRQGREIPLFSIGNPKAQHQVLWVCGQHGDELDAVQACVYLMQDLLKRLPTDPLWQARLQQARWHLVPVLNPDGLIARTRKNAAGVNLNSNWDAGWSRPLADDKLQAEVFSPTGSNYHGEQAFSEPETQALASWISRHRPQLIFDYHTGMASFSQGMVLFPYTQDLANRLSDCQYSQLKALAQKQADLLSAPHSGRDPVMAFQTHEILDYLRPAIQKHVPKQYHHQALSQLPPFMQSTGSLIDWSYDSLQIPALGFEISLPIEIHKPEAIQVFNQVYQDYGPSLEQALAESLTPSATLREGVCEP